MALQRSEVKWNRVEDGMPPMAGYQDGSTIRVQVWVEKDYYPHVYMACGEYSEDGFNWHVEGLSHLGRDGWKVTHWQPEPNRPENGRCGGQVKYRVHHVLWSKTTNSYICPKHIHLFKHLMNWEVFEMADGETMGCDYDG